MPGVVAGLLLVFIPLAGEYVTPAVLGGAKGLMAGGLVASQFLAALNWALGSAMAVVLILLILAVIAVFGGRRSDRQDHGQAKPPGGAGQPDDDGRCARPSTLGLVERSAADLCGARLRLSVHPDPGRGHLLVQQGAVPDELGWLREPTGTRRRLQNEGIQRALATSVRVAAVNALVAVVLGTMAGIALARRSGKWSRPFLILVFLILVAPEIVDAISYLIFFVRINLGWSFARLVIGHSIFNSAVVTLIVLARLQGLDESLEEAAADLGATPVAGVPTDHPAVDAPGGAGGGAARPSPSHSTT